MNILPSLTRSSISKINLPRYLFFTGARLSARKSVHSLNPHCWFFAKMIGAVAGDDNL
jgi:hypothetical protein